MVQRRLSIPWTTFVNFSDARLSILMISGTAFSQNAGIYGEGFSLVTLLVDAPRQL